MNLIELLSSACDDAVFKGENAYSLYGAAAQSLEITSLTDDSRHVSSGTLFCAIRGVHSDGHQYINKAIEQGASAILLETLPEDLQEGVCYIKTSDSPELMGRIASAWHGHPSRSMTVVGVTGTNGKTTIATLLYNMYREAGFATGLLSTVCNYIDGRAVPSTHTTPGAIALQALLSEMRDSGCSHVFMEVSSHSVAQRRIAGIDFDGGIFTNLTRDHLDYHGTVLEYLKAKKRFFDDLPAKAFALTNVDEKSGPVMLQNTQARKVSYALHSPADYKAQVVSLYPDSTDITINQREVTIQLVGEFNVYNLVAVYAAAVETGLSEEEAIRQLSLLRSVSGRLETLRSEAKGYTAFVDYAHTPDALVNVLETIRTLRDKLPSKQKSQIITVVGCGGDRDKGKRPLMAGEALRLSDKVILTSDNPRSEDPMSILNDMKAGLDPTLLMNSLTIVDRAEAIRTATMLAQQGDYILIAGKGHETYQEIQGVKHPFDDREVLRAVFEQEGKC